MIIALFTSDIASTRLNNRNREKREKKLDKKVTIFCTLCNRKTIHFAPNLTGDNEFIHQVEKSERPLKSNQELSPTRIEGEEGEALLPTIFD